MPSDEEIEKGEIDDDELENIEEQVEMDYQIGEDLKEKVSVHISFRILVVDICPDYPSCNRLLHW